MEMFQTPKYLYMALAICVTYISSDLEPVWADGTETLGPPSIAIEAGTGIIAAGTGLVTQPGIININVPGDVQQALLYWECQQVGNLPGDDTISVNGNDVTGTLIGGQTRFFSNVHSSTYRADVTALGLLAQGPNSITVDDLGCTRVNNGAGVLVIFDDGSGMADIDIRDGNDLAFFNLAPTLDTTVPQSFVIDPADVGRTATLVILVSSVSGTASTLAFRPSAIEVMVGGTTTVFDDLLDSTDGEEWDTVNLEITIPAGATMLTVQVLSVDNPPLGGVPASFAWNGAGLSLIKPTPTPTPATPPSTTTPSPTSVPTLSEWGIILLTFITMLIVSRRFRNLKS